MAIGELQIDQDDQTIATPWIRASAGGVQTATPFGTYTINITGTLSNITHTVGVNLTVG